MTLIIILRKTVESIEEGEQFYAAFEQKVEFLPNISIRGSISSEVESNEGS